MAARVDSEVTDLLKSRILRTVPRYRKYPGIFY